MLIPTGFATGVVALLIVSAQPVAANHHPEHGDACGDTPYYVCGEILVILEESADDGIDEVIGRQGGNPDTDPLDQFEGVRDLLAPTDEAVDMSPTTVYLLAVAVGQEQAAAEAYAADEAVYAAAVNRETIGTLTPNTAMPYPAASLWLGFVAVLVGLAVAILGRQGFAARRRG